jgi:sucrose phosphorylase
MHTFQTGTSDHLSRWAGTLAKVSDTATYLNFLDSHDGVGLLPVHRLLEPDEVDAMIVRAMQHGGLISYRTDDRGEKVPYEINITWWSVINRSGAGEPLDLQVDRFIASRSISLALRGVPALYLLGVVGSDNDVEAVTSSGDARSINRTALDAGALAERIEDHEHRTGMIFRRLGRMLRRRSRCRAFHPNGGQRVLSKGSELFALLRVAPDGGRAVVAVTNVTAQARSLELTVNDLEAADQRDVADGDDPTATRFSWARAWRELISGSVLTAEQDRLTVELEPYAVMWLEPRNRG